MLDRSRALQHWLSALPARTQALPWPARYAVPLALVPPAALITGQVPQLAEAAPMGLLFLVVLLTSWAAGFWPGLLVVLVATGLADSLFLPRPHPFHLQLQLHPSDLVFVLNGLVTCLTQRWLRRARAQHARAAWALARYEKLLEASNIDRPTSTRHLDMVDWMLRHGRAMDAVTYGQLVFDLGGAQYTPKLVRQFDKQRVGQPPAAPPAMPAAS
jgi:K+-sensing histidine kinase KdpD